MPSSHSTRVFRDDREAPSRTAAERQRSSQLQLLANLRLLRRDRALEEVAGAKLELSKAQRAMAEVGERLEASKSCLNQTNTLIDALVQTGAAELREIHRGNDAVNRARFEVDRHERQHDRSYVAVYRADMALGQCEQAARASALAYERISECKNSL
jgi:hypothetical protein